MLGQLLSPKRAPLAAGAVVLAAACTPFEPGSDELSQETPSLTTASTEDGPDWSCLDTAPPEMPLVGPRAPQLLQSLQVLSSATNLVPPNVSVRACAQRDTECLAPLTPPTPIDAEGWVDLMLYEGFDGYLEITSPGAVPSMLFYGQPLTNGRNVDPEPAFLVEMDTALAFDRLFLGREAFPNTGVINIRALDCQNAPAPAVQFTLAPAAVGWYYVGEIPVASAQATTESGVGGFSDVAPGTVVVTAELAEDGRPLAPPQSVFVRGGWFTNIRFRH